MKYTPALSSGLAGTFTVALLHESLKKISPAAPRMEALDMEALSKVLNQINIEVPEREKLLKLTLAAELLSHTLYYGFVTGSSKKGVWFRGILAGLAAGISAVVLPGPLGLQGAPTNRSPQTEAMTIALYLTGG